MTDLTVLVSPMPLAPISRGLFSKKAQLSTPIMVTLESETDPNGQEVDAKPPSSPGDAMGPYSRKSRSPRNFDTALLSPPVNTWKAPKTRPRHRPTRSRSAPPERRALVDEVPAQRTQELPIGFEFRPPPPRRRTTTSFTAGTRAGELIRPPPPLLRPTTFWRKTKKSGVAGPSYSPSTHLIRRSTYIAAGLSFDAPVHDLSALCVESRVGFLVIPPEQEF
ncbi:hypothetical protein D9611_014503 [Ephemerocybe angulata]|uniref:Uncharacterized protein n=1 Tax=Ephemerocybe angulata TaxID=980116 RepID=A0A8H5FEV6_9AGAR|nr:hypothetical protein D9611_014503 [Tulosesus angulatus]